MSDRLAKSGLSPNADAFAGAALPSAAALTEASILPDRHRHSLLDWPSALSMHALTPGFQIDVSAIRSPEELVDKLAARLVMEIKSLLGNPSEYALKDLTCVDQNFNERVLKACAAWSQEAAPIMLWDIDETLTFTKVGIRPDGTEKWCLEYLRPGIPEVFEYIKTNYPQIRHGILTARTPADLSDFLEKTNGLPVFRNFFDPALIQSCADVYRQVELDRAPARAVVAEHTGLDANDKILRLAGPNELAKAMIIWKQVDAGLNVHLFDDCNCGKLLPGRFGGGPGMYADILFDCIIPE